MKYSRLFKLCGITLSSVRGQTEDLTEKKAVNLFYEEREGDIYLQLTVEDPVDKVAEMNFAAAEELIRKRLAKYIYGTDNDTLEAAVGRLMAQRKITLAVAESCTGGLLAHRITNVPGSSAYFRLGVVAYDNRFKEEVLKVPRDFLAEFGAVSPQVARAMASGVRNLAGTTLGIGITGIAGPGGGTPTKPVGLVYICLDYGKNCQIEKLLLNGERVENKKASAHYALTMLYLHLNSWYFPR
ncbi:nicotinamide-nucleotide amidohydrolase family protein [Calderihabitans maritimus]|uniref:Predicted nucleotide-utilizing enzyme related to molybdopterin-biosynthesis enzyme MoeA n=1 Tax=Calderihabitans maritimus TaxID=1246530 RepID=A0A1Z5HV31_9FIRM|nr:nicotinamide-nucleotide amidohydrolase family protein [Calderihabitans maritimus]GAW93364.1 predicted nucleotide-utilizing enzyme related to molybdopterin-biosynthesis enzyme MoeA [Calderihabitans maritimus]